MSSAAAPPWCPHLCMLSAGCVIWARACRCPIGDRADRRSAIGRHAIHYCPRLLMPCWRYGACAAAAGALSTVRRRWHIWCLCVSVAGIVPPSPHQRPRDCSRHASAPAAPPCHLLPRPASNPRSPCPLPFLQYQPTPVTPAPSLPTPHPRVAPSPCAGISWWACPRSSATLPAPAPTPLRRSMEMTPSQPARWVLADCGDALAACQEGAGAGWVGRRPRSLPGGCRCWLGCWGAAPLASTRALFCC